jgi:hypothetical protein
MMTIEEIRQRFTIYDLILWSALICFGVILAMMHYTDNDDRKCIVYEGDSLDLIISEEIDEKLEKRLEKELEQRRKAN